MFLKSEISAKLKAGHMQVHVFYTKQNRIPRHHEYWNWWSKIQPGRLWVQGVQYKRPCNVTRLSCELYQQGWSCRLPLNKQFHLQVEVSEPWMGRSSVMLWTCEQCKTVMIYLINLQQPHRYSCQEVSDTLRARPWEPIPARYMYHTARWMTTI